jgi:hypothetical protein
MGRLMTRLSAADRGLQERVVEEARRCCASEVPTSEAVVRLVELAGDNPHAFQGLGGRSTRELGRTPDGQAVVRLIGLAEASRRNRNRVGVRRVVGQSRTPEEVRLASMPVGDGFDLLAEQDPFLHAAARDVVHMAETARRNGEDPSGVRRAVDGLVVRALGSAGRTDTVRSGLSASRTAKQVVATHLYELADVDVIDVGSGDFRAGG